MKYELPSNFYTKYIMTPAGRQVKAAPKDRHGVPRADDMGVFIEAGVAEAVTLQAPNFHKKIIDPIALTTVQMKELGFFGSEPYATDKEVKLQLFGVDMVVMPLALYHAFLEASKEEPDLYFSWQRVLDECVTIQVKYQPFAYAHRTINFETRNIIEYRKEFHKQPTEHWTKHNADYTAYVITDQVIILAPRSTYKGYTDLIQLDHFIGSSHKYSEKDQEGRYCRKTKTKRININSLLTDSATQILSMSELFGEYHAKAANALDEDEWYNSSIGHGNFSQNWSLSTLKSYLEVGIEALFEDCELKEGLHLRGTPHSVFY